MAGMITERTPTRVCSWSTLWMVTVAVVCYIRSTGASHDAKRLFDDLLRKNRYNKLIRPVGNVSDILTVKLGLKLSQIIDVDEKNQIMTTNVWLRQEWTDYKLMWDPKKYGGVERLYVPSDEIWLPDIVLYNSADGNFTVRLKTKATLRHDGVVKWEPPVIYQSSCAINVEFFPFDEQMCWLKLGSWSYDGQAVDIQHIDKKPEQDELARIQDGIDIGEYYTSTEWEILEVPANKYNKFYTCCAEPYPDIKFNITMRRKTLFYTVNLIMPTVAICMVTVLVFYIPSDSGEKITMCITILNSLNMLFLLVTEINPPTSFVTPLIGKYLLFTMVLVTLSIIVTVFVLNVHFRSPATHTMSPWVRKVFLKILPRLLLMRRPQQDRDKGPKVMVRTCNGVEVRDPFVNHKDSVMERNHTSYTHRRRNENILRRGHTPDSLGPEEPWDIKAATEGVTYIAQHLKLEDDFNKIKQDWKYVAMVLDRLFLWIFTTACVVGTCGIIFQAPSLYDKTPALV